MKQILGLLFLTFLLQSCDDGDMTVSQIDFSTVNAQKCSDKDVIYKAKDTEMLILSLPGYIFVEDETPEGNPVELPITSSNQVIYRFYDGKVSSNSICPTIPSATPNVTEEWKALSGTIQITSTAIKSVNSATNATKITGYKYYIEFKNITFQKPDGQQIYETFVFGNYTESITPLALGFDDQADKSSCDTRIFNFNSSEALILDVQDFDSLFKSEVTTVPRTALISADNLLTYQLYNNVITDTYFCTSPIPPTPTLSQEWNAVNGIEATSGIIEVTTTTLGAGYLHTVRLKKVTVTRGNSDFYLGDDYLFGSFVTD